MPTSTYLSIGSNLGDRLQHLRLAINEISSKIGKVVNVSHVYETEPVGFKSDNLFLNAILKVSTELQPDEELRQCKEIEKSHGRKQRQPDQGYADRPLDIDIIAYGNTSLSTERLTIPHPRLAERAFVLIPLAEIEKGLILPGYAKTTEELIEHLNNKENIKLTQYEL